jgi:hypothetical protein
MPHAEDGGGSEATVCAGRRLGGPVHSQSRMLSQGLIAGLPPTRLLARPKPPTVKDAGESGGLPCQPRAGVSCLGPWMTEA